MKKILPLCFVGLLTSSAIALAGSFPGGWCTSGVASVKGGIPWSGNARYWYQNAKNMGYSVAPGDAWGSGDKPGAIVVFGPAAVNGYMGHVAVSLGGGKFIEMNGNPCGTSWSGKCSTSYGKFNQSTWPIGGGAPITGYIYYKLSNVCPPVGSPWVSTNHPACR